MPLRGSYTAITRQLDELERRASRLTGAGCPVCADWGPSALVYPDPPQYEPEPGAPRYCRPWAPEPEERRAGWPQSLVCGACGREPELVVRIVYAEEGSWRTGFRPRSSWRPGDTS